MPYAKKLFSLALLFNAVLTLEYAIQILAGYYQSYPNWKPFPPFIVVGSFFWIIIPVAILNFFPAVSTGQTRCGRLWFHHYVYGLAVALTAGGALMIFTSIPLVDLITKNITDVSVNVGRFFVLGGLTLVIDDLPDVSKLVKKFLDNLKLKAFRSRKVLHGAQLPFCIISMYFCLSVVAHMMFYPQGFTLANMIFVGTLLVTSLTSLASFRRKIWLKLSNSISRDFS